MAAAILPKNLESLISRFTVAPEAAGPMQKHRRYFRTDDVDVLLGKLQVKRNVLRSKTVRLYPP